MASSVYCETNSCNSGMRKGAGSQGCSKRDWNVRSYIQEFLRNTPSISVRWCPIIVGWCLPSSVSCSYPPLHGLGRVESFLLDRLSVKLCECTLPFLHLCMGWDTPSGPVICQIMLISVTLSLPHNMWTLSLAHGFYLSVNFREARTNKVKKVIWRTHLVFHRTVTEQ